MTGKIQVLNVGDGDAIIIQLYKKEENLLIVVDGGHKSDYKNIVKPQLIKALAETQKIAPDIVVATHYDRDHIGGLIPLVEDYITNIKEVWVHKSPELTRFNHLINESEDVGYKKIGQFISEKLSEINHQTRSNIQMMLESIQDLENLLKIVPKEKTREVYSGYQYSNYWKEINVLGPTKTYYETLFPENEDSKNFILEEYISLSPELRKARLIMEKISNIDPCKMLKTESQTRLTPTNKASIIFSIDKEDKRFLFTGDAGIGSFKAIPNWKTELKNLHWLKIPHHGSDNNISKEIIELMRPEYAYNSGQKHQDGHVLDCIAKNPRSIKVCSTKNGRDLEFEI